MEYNLKNIKKTLTESEKKHIKEVEDEAKKMEVDDLRRPLEGYLQKFTNLMKGYQYRWFVLNPITGMLEYYLLEDNYKQKCKPRNAIHLGGAVISPSEEDSYTFIINATNNEFFKIKTIDAKERQIWINRLRSTAELHVNADLDHNLSISNLPPISAKSQIINTSSDFINNLFSFDLLSGNAPSMKKYYAPQSKSIGNIPMLDASISLIEKKIYKFLNNLPSDPLIHPTIRNYMQRAKFSLSRKTTSNNQFKAVKEVLRCTEKHYKDIKYMIETLPKPISFDKASYKSAALTQSPSNDTPLNSPEPADDAYRDQCSLLGPLDPDLLLLKATGCATFNSLKTCLSILEHQLLESNLVVVVRDAKSAACHDALTSPLICNEFTRSPYNNNGSKSLDILTRSNNADTIKGKSTS